jgi:hypothetical protein
MNNESEAIVVYWDTSAVLSSLFIDSALLWPRESKLAFGESRSRTGDHPFGLTPSLRKRPSIEKLQVKPKVPCQENPRDSSKLRHCATPALC